MTKFMTKVIVMWAVMTGMAAFALGTNINDQANAEAGTANNGTSIHQQPAPASTGSKIKKNAKKTGKNVKKSTDKTAHNVKDSANDAASKVKQSTNDAANDIKTKVDH